MHNIVCEKRKGETCRSCVIRKLRVLLFFARARLPSCINCENNSPPDYSGLCVEISLLDSWISIQIDIEVSTVLYYVISELLNPRQNTAIGQNKLNDLK